MMEFAQPKGNYIVITTIILMIVIPVCFLWHKGYRLHRIPDLDRSNTAINHTINHWRGHTGNDKCREGQSKHPLCIPDDRVRQMLDFPDVCDERFLILPCSDPCLDFLSDKEVFNKCHVKKDDIRDYQTRFPQAGDDQESSKSDLPAKDCPKPEIQVSEDLVFVGKGPRRKIPNLVHYINLGCERNFSFTSFVSVVSAWRFIRPEKIYFHGDCEPVGVWWKKTLKEVPNIYFRPRERLRFIQGRKPDFIKHEIDVIKLQVLLGKS